MSLTTEQVNELLQMCDGAALVYGRCGNIEAVNCIKTIKLFIQEKLAENNTEQSKCTNQFKN